MLYIIQPSIMSLSSLHNIFRNYVYTTLPQFVKQTATKGANVDTHFQDSWMSMRQRTPMMRKTMNRSRIFEIEISLRA